MELFDDMIMVTPDEANLAKRIVLPKWSKGLQGTVINAGPGMMLPDGKRIPMEVKVGDKVSFGAATGMESVFKGMAVRMMRQTDLLGVVEE
jgi:chaperonin GroES